MIRRAWRLQGTSRQTGEAVPRDFESVCKHLIRCPRAGQVERMMLEQNELLGPVEQADLLELVGWISKTRPVLSHPGAFYSGTIARIAFF